MLRPHPSSEPRVPEDGSGSHTSLPTKDSVHLVRRRFEASLLTAPDAWTREWKLEKPGALPSFSLTDGEPLGAQSI